MLKHSKQLAKVFCISFIWQNFHFLEFSQSVTQVQRTTKTKTTTTTAFDLLERDARGEKSNK
jgi:hypothetical protein